MTTPQEHLAKQLGNIEKRLGKGMVHPASESPPVYHLPFISPHLNYATEGGAPWNRFVALAGDESTGKTKALYELYAMAQALPGSMDSLWNSRIEYHRGHGHGDVVARLEDELEWVHDHFPDGATCCHYDIEQQFDKMRAAKIGVDIDKLFIAESNIIEDVCDTLGSLFGAFHIHGLDSTSNAVSSKRVETGKGSFGPEAKQWKEKLLEAQTFFGPLKNDTGIPNMVVMIHQMSTNVKTGGVQQATGRYLKFISSCSIQFSRGAFLWKKDGVLLGDKVKAFGTKEKADEVSMAGRAEADGVEVYAQIVKSRTCRPFRTASMQFDYKKLMNVTPHELASSGLFFGIITQSGSWFKVDGEKKNIGQGLKSVYTRLAEDEELRNRITSRLLDFTDEDDSIDMAKKQAEAEEARAVIADAERVTAGK
jgi:RecA/RadA recombinase